MLSIGSNSNNPFFYFGGRTPPSVPNSVQDLSLNIPTSSGGQLSWTLPSNGGSPIISQIIERSPAGANTWTVLNNAIAGNATIFQDTTASPNTAYDYRHRSTNSVGNSDYSNVVTITTSLNASVPSTVSDLFVSSPSAFGGILEWTLPSDGGSAITSQTIQRSLSGQNIWTNLVNNLPSNANSYTDTTANPETQYDYRHRSTNAIGNSGFSNIATVTTLINATEPLAVSDLVLATPTTTGGTLTWTLPNNGGASITSQTIQRSPAGANNWTTLSSSIAGNATSFTDTTAASSTQYDYRHRSTNSVGNSNFSNVVTITTASSATVPAAVNNLVLATPTTTGGTLTWTLPNNGGSPLVSQRIERSPTGQNTWSILDNAITANATSFTDTTAVANTAYDYRHRSTNGVGNSAYSNVVTITTAALITFPDTADIIYRFEAGNVANTTVQTNQTFAPSDVIVAENRIALPDLKYPTQTSYLSSYTRVYFSSTGTLPAPLQPNTPYYLAPDVNGGYEIYPEMDSTHWVNLDFIDEGDFPTPAQNVIQKRNRIVLTTQGTGTHTVFSKVLMQRTRNIHTNGVNYGNGYAADNNRHQFCETDTDARGDRFIESRILLRDSNTTGISNNKVYDLHGSSLPYSAPSVGDTTMQEFFRNKRQLIASYVLSWDETDTFGTRRTFTNSPANVNTTTGVLTCTGHTITTGWKVRLRAWQGATLPAGLNDSTTYFARNVSVNTLTLHPTLADAQNNTNPVIPTTQGTGQFSIIAFQYIADSERMRYITEIRGGGNNTLTVGTNAAQFAPSTENTLLLPDFVVSSGANNGRFGFGTGSIAGFVPTVNDVFKVRIWMTPGCTRPVRSDTGQPLANGEYWITREPGSSTATRLYATEAAALADAANGTLSNAASQCIKFTSSGEGNIRVESAEGRPISCNVQNGTLTAAPNFATIPLFEKGVLTVVADYNNPDPAVTGIQITMYWNGNLLSQYVVTGSTKGLTLNSYNPSPLLFNSAQIHVPFQGKLYAAAWGATATTFDPAIVTQINDYMKQKYGIA